MHIIKSDEIDAVRVECTRGDNNPQTVSPAQEGHMQWLKVMLVIHVSVRNDHPFELLLMPRHRTRGTLLIAGEVSQG